MIHKKDKFEATYVYFASIEILMQISQNCLLCQNQHSHNSIYTFDVCNKYLYHDSALDGLIAVIQRVHKYRENRNPETCLEN